jgi:hypothetical protein
VRSSPFHPFTVRPNIWQQDDGFGPFSDVAAVSGADPFTFADRFGDENEDISFDSFGDFGEFQAAGVGHGDGEMGDFHAASPSDGEMTPTGSWTFASRGSFTDSDGSSEDGGGTGSGMGMPLKERLEHISLDEERRT